MKAQVGLNGRAEAGGRRRRGNGVGSKARRRLYGEPKAQSWLDRRAGAGGRRILAGPVGTAVRCKLPL